MNLYVLLSFKAVVKREDGNQLPSCRGIWRRRVEDLNLKGTGLGEGVDDV